MRLEIKDTKKCNTFITIFNNLKYITDKIHIIVNKDHLYLQGMDNSHVCIYELHMYDKWFDTWNVENEMTFGFYLPIFNRILNIHNEKQGIIVELNDDKLNIEFISEEKGMFNKYFEMPLMDIESELFNIPDTEYDADIIIESKKIKSLIDELSNFNDTLRFSCSENDLVMESSSEEGSMKVVINMDDIDSYEIIENAELNTSFSIKYIVHMCQFYKLCNNTEIHISEGIPLQIKYNICDDCHMKFYLAPKIDD